MASLQAHVRVAPDPPLALTLDQAPSAAPVHALAPVLIQGFALALACILAPALAPDLALVHTLAPAKAPPCLLLRLSLANLLQSLKGPTGLYATAQLTFCSCQEGEQGKGHVAAWGVAQQPQHFPPEAHTAAPAALMARLDLWNVGGGEL